MNINTVTLYIKDPGGVSQIHPGRCILSFIEPSNPKHAWFVLETVNRNFFHRVWTFPAFREGRWHPHPSFKDIM